MKDGKERYSVLRPLNITESTLIATSALEFFHPMNNVDVRKLLSIPINNSQILPMPAEKLFDYIKYKNPGFEPFKYMHHIRSVLDKMEVAGYLTSMGNSGNVLLPKTYYAMRELTTKQVNARYWMSEFLGADFIDYYFNINTVQILGESRETMNEHAGTGILIGGNFILTCKHVIEEMCLYPIQNIQGQEKKIKDTFVHDNIDVGLIEIDNIQDLLINPISFRDPIVNDELYIIGYPPVPFTRHSSSIMQKGEVTNPSIRSLDNFDLFLFSAIARPGNSGGPVISRSGEIVGIVTRELSLQHGKQIPFFAGIPTSAIQNALLDMGFESALPVEDYT